MTETEQLLRKVKKFLDHSWREHKRCKFWNNLIVWVGALTGVLVVASGAYGLAELAAVFGAITSALIIIQKNYGYAESSYIWEQCHSKAKNIRDRLEFSQATSESFEGIFQDWMSLREHLITEKPALRGLEEVT